MGEGYPRRIYILKYILVIINALLYVVGFALLIIGLIQFHDGFANMQNTARVANIIAISTGIALLILPVFGILIVLMERRKALFGYLLIVAIFCLIHSWQTKSMYHRRLDINYLKVTKALLHLQDFYLADASFRDTMDHLQRDLTCCGVLDSGEWLFLLNRFPSSCCPKPAKCKPHKVTCSVALKEYFMVKASLMFMLFLAASCFELFLIILGAFYLEFLSINDKLKTPPDSLAITPEEKRRF